MYRRFMSKNSIIFPYAKRIDFFPPLCYNKTMKYIFDKWKLEAVLADFYRSTGIAITLYDASERIVATSPAYTRCCSLIRTKKKCVENCECSNLIHMKEVLDHGGNCRYTCHAGLMEMIVPIMYDGVLIAFLQIGQFRDAQQIYSSSQRILETADRYGFDRDQLLTLYNEVPVVSEEKLQAVCNVMEILIKFFWNDGLISYRCSMLSVKMEQYISNHLSEKIKIEDLCNTFHLSKNALYQLFREEFHSTVNEFVMKRRLEESEKYLISEPEFNVTEVSSRCGFSDYNYFIRWFKKQTGQTPLQFRKNQKSGL